jgi:hypothetical protein
MRFHETTCGDWFRVKDAVFLACDHTKEIALKFDAAGKFIARVRLQPDTEIEFLGRYVTSAFEIAGENRTPPRGPKGKFVSSGRKVPKDGGRDGKAK